MPHRSASEPASPSVNAVQRQAIHDLRNLFAIIGAAKSLLERDLVPSRRAEILAAVGEATRQGGRLTTDLLANCADQSGTATIDIMERLTELAPMLRVLTDTEINLARACRSSRLLVRLVPADFDAAMLELVSNAAAAGAIAVTIRLRLCGGRIWLLVADNGCGMSAATLQRARRGRDLGLAHGTGLSRVRQFMTANGGDVLVRSQPGGGTTFALIFPISSSGPPLASHRSAFPAFGKPQAQNPAAIPHPLAA